MKYLSGKTFIIAEAGVNHNGSLEMAKDLIREAKARGADCIKFQTFKADRIVTRNAPKARYQLRTTDRAESQLEMLKKLELPDDAYGELMALCSEEGLMFLSTPYDLKDIDFLNDLGVEAFKVASGQIVEPHFLKYMASKGKPMIVSTGMATLGEVDEAVRTIKGAFPEQTQKHGRLPALCLLQCTTNYPSDLADANLKAMTSMGRAFGLPMGYSDHTEGIVACIVAVALGAEIIEKHFTSDKSLPGPDQACSSDPKEFERLVIAIRQAEETLGSGVKAPTDRELENAEVMRRGLVASRDLPEGKTLEPEDIDIKRPLNGLPARFLDLVLGKTLRASLQKNECLDFEVVSKK